MESNKKIADLVAEKDLSQIARSINSLLVILLDHELIKARGVDLGPNEVYGIDLLRRIEEIAREPHL
jgi:hypothetical protein